MQTDEMPKRNLVTRLWLPIAILILCVICIGAAALVYFYWPIFPGDEVSEDAAAESTPDSIEPTATSILDAAFTNPVNQAVPPNVDTPTPQATPTPSLTATADLTTTAGLTATAGLTTLQFDPAQLSDATASGYITVLLLEGSLSILEDTARQMEAGTLGQAARDDILVAMENVFSQVGSALAEAPPDAAFIDVWPPALETLTLANELVQSWLIDQVSSAEVTTALRPARAGVNDALLLMEGTFDQYYAIKLDGLSQARTEVATVLRTSLEGSSGPEAIDLSLPAPERFPAETPLPLSDTLPRDRSLTYVSRILEVTENFSTLQERLLELKDQRPKPFVRDTRDQEMELSIAAIEASSRIIKQIELPTRLAKTRKALLIALADCDTAVPYLASGLDNPDDWTTGLNFLKQCNAKLARPNQDLQTFVDSKGSEPSAEPEAAPSPPTEAAVTCEEGCTILLPGCIIKGEITEEDNAKVYYLPGGEFYGEAQIDPVKGERWFCKVEEAADNGWK